MHNVNPYQTPADDEIDLRDLWNIVWNEKWIIMAITALFAIGSVIYALSLSNIYESKVLLAPSGEVQGGGISRMAGQLGGLASLAGISIPSGNGNKITKAIEVMKSRKFITDFIGQNNILPELMAVKGWDINKKKLIFDEDIYDANRKKWVRDVEPPKTPEPSMWEAYKAFTEIMTVSQNLDTGFVTVAIRHKSPYIAKKWTAMLVEEVNAIIREDDVGEAQRSIEYLQLQLSKVSVADMRNVFYQLIEEQTKIIMLAEARQEYVFSTIDPPVVPEEKVGPYRSIICLAITLVGGVFAVISVFILHIINGNKARVTEETR